jgi:hypothetical protein
MTPLTIRGGGADEVVHPASTNTTTTAASTPNRRTTGVIAPGNCHRDVAGRVNVSVYRARPAFPSNR